MKKFFIFWLIILFFSPSFCLADFSSTKWQYYKVLTGQGEGLKRFVIDDDIFAHTKDDLRDLRIIDSVGKEVPYKLLRSKTSAKTESYRPRHINNVYVPGEGASVILDFGPNAPLINKLKINTKAENFQRNVIISGANNLDDWNIIKDNAYIYDYTDKRGNFKSRNTIVKFSDSLFRYLKVKIVDSGKNPVKIDSVSAFSQIIEKAKTKSIMPKLTLKEDYKNHQSKIFLDMGMAGIPVGKISLTAVADNFKRVALLYSSINNKDWRSLGQFYLFRFHTPRFNGQNMSLIFPESTDRYYKIEIENNDNQPIKVSKAVAFSTFREVVFEAEKDKTYKIFYGNPQARFPRYDIESFFQYLDVDNAASIALSPEKINNRYIPPKGPKPRTTPKSETIPHLMTIGLITAILLLAFLVYGFFRQK